MSSFKLKTPIEELRARISTIQPIKEKALLVYNQMELEETKSKLGLPCIGVVYMGLRGKEDSSKTGGACTLTIDVHLLGADKCNLQLSGELCNAFDVMDLMRESLIGDCPIELPQTRRKWKFVYEQPEQVDGLIGYVQRWQTTIVAL